MHNVIRYARNINERVDDVLQMDTRVFFERLNILDGLIAEEKFILQRQLDNHVKYGKKATAGKFTGIYDEFISQMKRSDKTKKKELTQEEKLAIHKANLVKLGL